MIPRFCAACRKPLEPGFRKYCSDACSYGAQRALMKIRAAGERMPKRTFQYRRVSVAPPGAGVTEPTHGSERHQESGSAGQ